MKINRIGAGVALTAALVLGGATAAFATTNYPSQGGTWTYGLSTGLISPYSNYYHGSKCHGSSVVTDWASSRSIDTYKGKTSHAQAAGNAYTHDKYYFRVC
jgi:lactococcin 972 family bacteriocin